MKPFTHVFLSTLLKPFSSFDVSEIGIKVYWFIYFRSFIYYKYGFIINKPKRVYYNKTLFALHKMVKNKALYNKLLSTHF